MPEFLFGPCPNAEAVDFLKSKPVVSREVFNQLLPELKARAFTISGVEDMSVVQAIRDRIADLPAGVPWDVAKKDLVKDLHPWLDDEPDESGAVSGTKRSEARAELLLRTHGFQAYSASAERVMDRQRDVFPYCQYKSMEDARVRPTHEALDGVVLPADHEFWLTHTPPWDWGCRCLKIPISEDDLGDIKASDEGKNPDNRDILDEPAARELSSTRRLVRNGVAYNMTAPAESGKPGAFTWTPGSLRIPIDQLRQQYMAKGQSGAETFHAFETWARNTRIEPHSDTIWEWLGGSPILPPTAPPAPPQPPAPEKFGDMVKKLGLAAKPQWKESDAKALFGALKKPGKRTAADHIAGITGAPASGPLSAGAITSAVQDMVDRLPDGVLATLPKLSIQVFKGTIQGDANRLGDYASGVLRLSVKVHKQFPGDSPKTTLYHELMHWVHRDAKGPAADAYRAAVKAHYLARTAGDVPLPDGAGGCYRKDQWWRIYAGREYALEHGHPAGLEVPTVYYELWANPKRLVQQLDPAYNPHAAHFIETLDLVMGIFNP